MLLVVISIRGFKKVERSPRRSRSIHLSFGERSRFIYQGVKISCSQSFVPRALLRIVTEPRTASNCTLFVVIFPGMVFNISMRFFVIIPAAPTITGTTLAFFSFQNLFTSLLRSWYLDIFLISASLIQYHRC